MEGKRRQRLHSDGIKKLKKGIDRFLKVCYTKITKGKKGDCYCVATVNLLGFQEKKNWSKKIKNL